MSNNSPVVSGERWDALPRLWGGGGDWTTAIRRFVMRMGSMIFALAVAVGGQVGGAGSAAADSVVGALRYNCVLSSLPGQAMTVRLNWHAPSSIAVGQPTPAFSVDAAATVGPTVTWALGLVGATTVEGNVNAPGVVRAPEGDIDVALPLTVTRSGVPASGPMTVRATGTAPQRVFRQPGSASITAGNTMTMHLVPKDAGGNPTPAGEVNLTCTLDPGQDTVVFSFVITPAPATSRTAAPPAPETSGRAPSPTEGGVPTRPKTAVTATPGAVGSPPSSVGTFTSDSAPESAGDTSTEIANAASTAVAQRRWWLIGAGILAVVAAALGGLWWWQRQRRT